MADGLQSGASDEKHKDEVIEHKDLLKFQRYRDRLRVLGAEGKVDELVAHYDMHAKSFGKFFEITGYKGGIVMADAVVNTEPNITARILDCASGDGVVGSCLQKLGYSNLDALDPSPAMIAECRQKNIYSNLVCDYVKQGHTTIIDNETYDVIVVCAAFCPGHMNQSCFDELTRMTKPGGYILFNISNLYLKTYSDFNNGKLATAVQDMIIEGLWASVNTHTAPYFTSGVVEDCMIFTVKTAQK